MDEMKFDAGSAAAPSADVPPPLKQGETFHVFISYSSTDSQWTHSLIQQLEAQGLHVCYHERDFTAGRTVLENMSECIQESQKVLLVLSSEFVRSRWCLLEANMSLFRDCLERKPIVPVLLEPAVCVPLHLCHLTYLEARDADFMAKLLKVLFTPNRQLQGSTVVPYQPPSIYNGKALQPLTAANVESLYKWDAGQFSDMDVPDQLRLIIEDPEKYRKAIAIINSVSQQKVYPKWLQAIVAAVASIFYLTLVGLFAFMITLLALNHSTYVCQLVFFCLCCVLIGALVQGALTKRDGVAHTVKQMQKAAGQANVILCEEKILMGCQSNSKVYMVYVSLSACQREFVELFSERANAESLFQRALLYFSSGYACCLAKRSFPFPMPASRGHLEGGVCFCQYVSMQLTRGEWM
ncbi:uncharacterized protein LOC109529833 [Hippocampus comes]|uniref:uncharacterized protein LOC109529833 n=1 Tax=Hippocampus comes TaxID=109280 RepID=UPI00094F0A71|nr:PREDICTED: uncharacterized protein LOC109529833 [Hippocampus comes]XP_019748876.1 PREDICTED: uncharacterized protein LOC109529833 [Hippocampus comes]XP_019748877.1 PREDICTED: uncharacterized protein LOC109529833 [Hippocampus comes]XP_019748878.1 PREDICTED: uncharacterized protein LOC109529833 [Hippocampus comes]